MARLAAASELSASTPALPPDHPAARVPTAAAGVLQSAGHRPRRTKFRSHIAAILAGLVVALRADARSWPLSLATGAVVGGIVWDCVKRRNGY
jgi:hypothetical protein